MTTTVAEIVRISRRLPKERAARLLDYARYLASRPAQPLRKPTVEQTKAPDGAAAWERILNDTKPRPRRVGKIRELEKLAAQGADLPPDVKRL